MELRDRDLLLRSPVEDDTDAVLAAIRLSMPDLEPWMAWASPAYDASMARSWIRGQAGDVHQFVMIDPAGDMVGACGLNRLDETNRRANLGYWVRSDRHGRGYATTAARLLARFGLEEVALARVEIVMDIANEPSRRVAERIGARYEGHLRRRLLVKGHLHDAYLYSLVAGDL